MLRRESNLTRASRCLTLLNEMKIAYSYKMFLPFSFADFPFSQQLGNNKDEAVEKILKDDETMKNNAFHFRFSFISRARQAFFMQN
jgi:hypothetical protein